MKLSLRIIVSMLVYLTGFGLFAQETLSSLRVDLDGSGKLDYVIEVQRDEDAEYGLRVIRTAPSPVVVDQYDDLADCERGANVQPAHLSVSKATEILVTCGVGMHGFNWGWIFQWRSNHLVNLNGEPLLDPSIDDVDGDGVDEVLIERWKTDENGRSSFGDFGYDVYTMPPDTGVFQMSATIPMMVKYEWGPRDEEETYVKEFTADAGRYELIVRNGPPGGRVDNAVLILNGVRVAGNSAFRKKPQTIIRNVTLRKNNQLRVLLRTSTACAMNIVLISE